MSNYRIYLDACCLNRPFDNLTQTRNYLEAEAVMTILQKCQTKTWQLINSTALRAELSQIPDLERLEKVNKILSLASIKVVNSDEIYKRASELQKLGFSAYDATHLASAEKAKADIFLSTDDRLLKKAQRYSQIIHVKVNNPMRWLSEVIQIEESNDEN